MVRIYSLIFGNMGNQKIGIINEGEGTKIYNNEFHGYDIGIKSKGNNLEAKNNKFFTYSGENKWYEIWWGKYIIFPIIVGIILLVLGIGFK